MTHTRECPEDEGEFEWLNYVPLADVGPWLAAGWTISNDLSQGYHGVYSVLMVWKGVGDPPKP